VARVLTIFPKSTDQTASPGGGATTLGYGTAISGGAMPLQLNLITVHWWSYYKHKNRQTHPITLSTGS